MSTAISAASMARVLADEMDRATLAKNLGAPQVEAARRAKRG
jgi:hypothetical protein